MERRHEEEKNSRMLHLFNNKIQDSLLVSIFPPLWLLFTIVKLNPNGGACEISQLFWKDVFMVTEVIWTYIFTLKNSQSLFSLNLILSSPQRLYAACFLWWSLGILNHLL